MSFKPEWDQAAKIRTLAPLLLNCNAAGGELTWTGLPAKYRVISLYAFDASAAPVLATAGLYTATGGGGTTLVTAATLTALTAATKMLNSTLAAGATSDYQTAATLFLRNAVAQGTALTVSFSLVIQDLT